MPFAPYDRSMLDAHSVCSSQPSSYSYMQSYFFLCLYQMAEYLSLSECPLAILIPVVVIFLTSASRIQHSTHVIGETMLDTTTLRCLLDLFCSSSLKLLHSSAKIPHCYSILKCNTSTLYCYCLLYTSPSPRDGLLSRMPSSA